MKVIKSHRCFGGVTEFYEHTSELTQTTMKFSVARPLDSSQIKGAILWLSGLTCTDENFITKAGSQPLLDDLMIVCPDTSPRGLDLPEEHKDYDFGSGASFYLDALTPGYKEHYKMFSYINEELYNLVQNNFGVKNLSIMGHSMGGHGALVSGLRRPDLYNSISAFSPIVNPSQCPWGKKAFSGYLGEDKDKWKNYDACSLLENGSKHPQSILIHQGLADNFYPDQLLTDSFSKICKQENQPVVVNMMDGFDHSYYFIASFIKEHIDHHRKFLC